MKIKLTVDSRDKVFHQRFGSILDFPDEINFDSPLPDAIQPTGDVKCTCYTTCDIAEDQKNIIFDINDLWHRIPQHPSGADPRDVLGEAVENGLLPKGKKERLKDWKSYWRADIGSRDPFDNVRSAMMLIKTPIGVGTYWYREWSEGVLPVGKTPGGGHMYEIEGWKQINDEPHFIVEAWTGEKMFMSREVFNEALKPKGMQTWVLSTMEMEDKRKRNLFELIIDLMNNLYIALRDKIIEVSNEPQVVPKKPLEVPVAPKTSPPQPSTRELIYNMAEKWVGKDASPNNRAPQELACVEAVCFILQQAGVPIPSMLSTIQLNKWLRKSPLFKGTLSPDKGNIILCVTGSGNGSMRGHVGIFAEDSKIMSNDSQVGLWLENYRIGSWVNRWRTRGGMRIWYFTAV